ncbi:calcium homeostasis modulator protein 5 isoform 3-T4 [Molossus nigricans]
MEKFQKVLDLYVKHYTTLGYGLVTLLTAGGERIFSTAVFQCPCSATWNLPYGLVFLLVPALALFLLGYVLSARTWNLRLGLRESEACTCCGAALHRFLVCSQLSGAAALAPLTWVAVALLGGSFYECAASGNAFLARRLCPGNHSECIKQLPLVPCREARAADVQDLLKDLKAQSQVLGWILIAIVILFILIFVFVTRCLSSASFLQLKFWKIYLEQEQKLLQAQATECAIELAKKNVTYFFEHSHPEEWNTPCMRDWQHISSLYTYSMLHNYVNENENTDGNKSTDDKTSVELQPCK